MNLVPETAQLYTAGIGGGGTRVDLTIMGLSAGSQGHPSCLMGVRGPRGRGMRDDDKKVADSKRSGIFTSYFRLQTGLPRTCHVSYPPGLRPIPAGVGRAGGGRAEF